MDLSVKLVDDESGVTTQVDDGPIDLCIMKPKAPGKAIISTTVY